MKKALVESFGLSDKEAAVYLAALELGEAGIERIAKKSAIKRTTVYDVIDSLTAKGMMSRVLKQKRQYFEAVDPRTLEEKLEEKKTSFKNILPELVSIANLIDKKPRVRFYEGVEGVKQVINDLLKYPGRPFWGWVSGELFDVVDDKFFQNFVNQRLKYKIPSFAIVPRAKNLEGYIAASPQSLRQVKIDPSPGFKMDVEIGLYGINSLRFISYHEQVALIIESQAIFNSLKNVFDAHWARL